MFRFQQTPLLLLTLSLLLAACAGNSSNGAAGSGATPTGSEALFVEKGCIACHAISANDSTERIGPSMVGVAARSAQTIQAANYTGSATTVEAYLRESILNPEIYITQGYEPLMPKTYPAILSQQELADLVTYLSKFN